MQQEQCFLLIRNIKIFKRKWPRTRLDKLITDADVQYDLNEEIGYQLEPLIATPSSPGNVVPVREVQGRDYQLYWFLLTGLS